VGGAEGLGYLAGPQDTSTGVARLEAFRSACGSFGIDQYPMLLGGYVEEQGYVGTQELLKLGVSAIIAGDSMMTVGALRACHEHRLTPGFDIALVGFDDFPVFQLQNPPLTIINQHVSTMGAKAFEELHKLLRGDSAQHKIKLPTTLIVRGSTPPKDSASDSSGQGGH